MSEWISVKDRLPPEDELILVVYEKKVTVGSRWKSGLAIFDWEYTGDGQWVPNEEITHWMPLPKPPEGE